MFLVWCYFLQKKNIQRQKIALRIKILHLVFVSYKRSCHHFCGFVNIATKNCSIVASRNMKNVLRPTMTHFQCRNKDKSQTLFHQSLTQLTTVKLGFNQIRTMACVFSGFRYTLLFLVLVEASQGLAKPGNSANSTPVSSSATKHCNNVYNSFYAGPNKKIETILQEMKKQLTQLQDDMNMFKENKTTVKGKIYFIVGSELRTCFKTLGMGK